MTSRRAWIIAASVAMTMIAGAPPARGPVHQRRRRHGGQSARRDEMIPGSSHMEPVNWRGDGQEFALLSGNIREGGMIDGHLRRVVMFPDDGHPDLAAAVHDLTGDARDEIVLWDQSRVWIYTQDRPFTGSRIYKPVRNPTYNDSNYRATVSLPEWADLKAGPTVERGRAMASPTEASQARRMSDPSRRRPRVAARREARRR